MSDGQQVSGCSYELRDPPGRRLRRWPWRAPLGHAADSSDPAAWLWPVLKPHRWLWDE